MSDFDGNPSEMPGHRPVDDGAIEELLAGTARGDDLASLSSFVSSVRVAAEAVPPPSPALAAVLAAGFSTEKGDLPATAASNVNGPASQEAGLSKWRTAKMKIRGFLAGLGVAGKVALGLGVAAAATTGAGAAGILPVTFPGTSHGHHHASAKPAVATTTTTSASPHNPIRVGGGDTDKDGGKGVVIVTPTTVETLTPTTVAEPAATPTTELETPSTEATPTTVRVEPEPPATDTTTTEPHSTMPIDLSCALTDGNQVRCTWTQAPTPVVKYSLWRWKTNGDGTDYGPLPNGSDALTFTDTTAVAGTAYTYRVFTTLDGGASGPVSNRAYITCCG